MKRVPYPYKLLLQELHGIHVQVRHRMGKGSAGVYYGATMKSVVEENKSTGDDDDDNDSESCNEGDEDENSGADSNCDTVNDEDNEIRGKCVEESDQIDERDDDYSWGDDNDAMEMVENEDSMDDE